MLTHTLSRGTVLSISAHAALLCTALMIAFGPLTPPGGAVNSTAKPLSEVEPRTVINATNTPGDANSLFKITLPGSYYLTGNVTGLSAKHGIKIAASNVTLDLMGFTVQGVSGSLDGISNDNSSTVVDNVRITNGTVTGWGTEGIQLNAGTNHLVDHVNTRSNGGFGIILKDNALVESCSAAGNAGDGIFLNGQNSVIRSCIASGNTGAGVSTTNGGLITDCTAYANTVGVRAGVGTDVTACAARNNTADGITVSSNGSISNCASYNNGDDGYVLGVSCSLSNCTSTGNNGDGIECSNQCKVTGNLCDFNNFAGTASGIHITGINCRIEGNTLTRNHAGLTADGNNNLVIHNTAIANTLNYVLVVGNRVGPIAAPPASAAISGSTGGGGVGSVDPSANFAY